MARGSIRRRSHGTWELRWDAHRGNDGRRKQRSRTFRGTRKAADAELNRIEADLVKSEEERVAEIPVRELCRLFLEERTDKDLRPGTIERYEGLFRLYLIPECGDVALGRLVRNDLQRVVQATMDRNLADSSVRALHGYLCGLFSWAVKAEYLKVSPAVGLSLPPAGQKSAGQTLSAEESVERLAVFKGTEYWLPVTLALYTGMRPGEVLGLCWDGVDWEDSSITVSQTMTRRGGELRIGPPKTKYSLRTVVVPEYILGLLREADMKKPDRYWRRYRPRGTSLGRGFTWTPIDFRQVCAGWDGRILDESELRGFFTRMSERAGVRRVRLHDLRHTHASLLLLDGLPMHVISKRLGHASIQTTIDLYAHLLPNSDANAAAAFGEIMKLAS